MSLDSVNQMKAIDTNILVYAHREECEQHAIAKSLLKKISESHEPWALPWPCIYEFVRVVTHPRVFNPPSSIATVHIALDNLLNCPSLILLGESERHAQIFLDLLLQTKITGNLVHDAHIAVLLIEHGITEMITADTDFNRFTGFTVFNPFKK